MPNPLIQGFYTPNNGFRSKKKLIFAVEMKRFALFSLYWMASLLLMATVLYSMEYLVPEALLISTSLLPVAIIYRWMIASVSLSASRREVVKSFVCILLFVLIVASLAIHIAQAVILYYKNPETYEWHLELPPMLLNPVFLLSMLTLMIIGDYALGRILGNRMPEASDTITFASDLQSMTTEGQDASPSETSGPITFVSNRQSVTLARQEILYVESCDTEVWIHTAEGAFRNKTPISSWGRLLGPEYLRIHRSYLVRLSACTGLDHDNVVLGDVRLPVSRKYKEDVLQCFSKNTIV